MTDSSGSRLDRFVDKAFGAAFTVLFALLVISMYLYVSGTSLSDIHKETETSQSRTQDEDESNSDSKASDGDSSEDSPGASDLVSERLPQVAVIGEKDGPGSTTEVFIQVPGVMNMQSVYVLEDSETVISGVVLPEVDDQTMPGGQMSMPDGKPSVNPTQSRPNAEKIRSMLAGKNAAAAKPSNDAAGGAPARGNAPSYQPNQQGQGAGAAPNQAPPRQTPQQPPQQGQAQSTPGNVPSPDPNEMGGNAASGQPPGDSGNADAGSQPQSGDAGNDTGNDSAETAEMRTNDDAGDELLEAEPFQDLVRDVASESDTITEMREAEGASEQQKHYYDAVSSMPAIKQGSGERDLYVLFDPNCPACHQLYQALSEEAGVENVTIHWIPGLVFTDQQSSIGTAAQLLAALDNEGNDQAMTMLDQILSSKDGASEVFGDYDKQAHQRYIEQVALGTGILSVAKPETPLLVYKNEAGELELESGAPAPGFLQNIAPRS